MRSAVPYLLGSLCLVLGCAGDMGGLGLADDQDAGPAGWTAPDSSVAQDSTVTPVLDLSGPNTDAPPKHDSQSPDSFVPKPDTFFCGAVKESFDRKDNNCNGKVDEGFWAWSTSVSYAELNGQQNLCPATPTFDIHCQCASHRYCQKKGYAGGFGPVEWGATGGSVVCLADAAVLKVKIDSLSAQHGTCKEATVFSKACFRATHKLCASKGYVSGVGPVEYYQGDSYIVCTKHAKVYSVNFGSTLNKLHSGCTDNNRFSPDCHAAINRFCQNNGYVSGNGPVETYSDQKVVCFNRK